MRHHPPARSRDPLPRRAALLAALLSSLLLAGCGGGGGGDGHAAALLQSERQARTLQQFGYDPASASYVHGLRSIAAIGIADAPSDVDMSRFGLTFDGRYYYLFAGALGNSTLVYSFRFNGRSYAFTGNSHTIHGAPSDADLGNFSVLHNGSEFRLYLRSHSDPTWLYQFGAASATDSWSPSALLQVRASGAPSDADWSRWAMFHDGSAYRQLVFKRGSSDTVYQFGWNGSSYAHGHSAPDSVALVGTPTDALTRSFAVLNDGAVNRMYLLSP